MTNILGISAFYHDSAACLIQNGDIVAAAQEERFTRKKHDPNFPENAIRSCLDIAGITSKDIDYVCFYDKPLLKFERLLKTYIQYAPKGLKSYLTAMPLWLKQKLWLPDIIREALPDVGEILFMEHHESHAASAFYPSPYQEAAILTLDGVGEWATASYGVGKGKDITITSEVLFPHSLGLLYSAFTYYTGFRVNSGEYKLMGLAPYGEPKYVDVIYDKLIEVAENGSFKLNMKYFNYCSGLTMTNRRFHKLFGKPPRTPETKITQKDMDLARSIQVVTEEIMLRLARSIHQETGQKKLVMAGGVALNCVGNGRLLREGPFDDIWIQPAAGDAGGALGAALFTWYQLLGNDRVAPENDDMQKASLLGPSFSREYIQKFIEKNNLSATFYEPHEMASKVAQLIADENVIGLLQNRMEFGPRALGSRSIIGDARSPSMQSKMNLKIKFRESFRPFAPSVLKEEVSNYFEIDRESPYMLLVAPVRKELQREMSRDENSLFGIEKLNISRSTIPAVTHVDYSARVQTVAKDKNPLYYNIIKSFQEKTGCPVIINTSFNVRGEPIVCTPEDAYVCFMRTDMDYLVLENYLLKKEDQPPFEDAVDWRKEFVLD